LDGQVLACYTELNIPPADRTFNFLKLFETPSLKNIQDEICRINEAFLQKTKLLDMNNLHDNSWNTLFNSWGKLIKAFTFHVNIILERSVINLEKDKYPRAQRLEHIIFTTEYGTTPQLRELQGKIQRHLSNYKRSCDADFLKYSGFSYEQEPNEFKKAMDDIINLPNISEDNKKIDLLLSLITFGIATKLCQENIAKYLSLFSELNTRKNNSLNNPVPAAPPSEKQPLMNRQTNETSQSHCPCVLT
jgi:hypothetical protein